MSQDVCLCGHGNTTAHSVRDRGCCRGLGVCRVKAYTYTCMFYIFIIICIFIWASQVALVVKKKKQKNKKPTYQCRRHKRHRFDPWVGKIPWKRKWQPTPVCFLSWEIPWTEEPGGLQSIGSQRAQARC